MKNKIEPPNNYSFRSFCLFAPILKTFSLQYDPNIVVIIMQKIQ